MLRLFAGVAALAVALTGVAAAQDKRDKNLRAVGDRDVVFSRIPCVRRQDRTLHLRDRRLLADPLRPDEGGQFHRIHPVGRESHPRQRRRQPAVQRSAPQRREGHLRRQKE